MCRIQIISEEANKTCAWNFHPQRMFKWLAQCGCVMDMQEAISGLNISAFPAIQLLRRSIKSVIPVLHVDRSQTNSHSISFLPLASSQFLPLAFFLPSHHQSAFTRRPIQNVHLLPMPSESRPPIRLSEGGINDEHDKWICISCAQKQSTVKIQDEVSIIGLLRHVRIEWLASLLHNFAWEQSFWKSRSLELEKHCALHWTRLKEKDWSVPVFSTPRSYAASILILAGVNRTNEQETWPSWRFLTAFANATMVVHAASEQIPTVGERQPSCDTGELLREEPKSKRRARKNEKAERPKSRETSETCSKEEINDRNISDSSSVGRLNEYIMNSFFPHWVEIWTFISYLLPFYQIETPSRTEKINAASKDIITPRIMELLIRYKDAYKDALIDSRKWNIKVVQTLDSLYLSYAYYYNPLPPYERNITTRTSISDNWDLKAFSYAVTDCSQPLILFLFFFSLWVDAKSNPFHLIPSHPTTHPHSWPRNFVTHPLNMRRPTNVHSWLNSFWTSKGFLTSEQTVFRLPVVFFSFPFLVGLVKTSFLFRSPVLHSIWPLISKLTKIIGELSFPRRLILLATASPKAPTAQYLTALMAYPSKHTLCQDYMNSKTSILSRMCTPVMRKKKHVWKTMSRSTRT